MSNPFGFFGHSDAGTFPNAGRSKAFKEQQGPRARTQSAIAGSYQSNVEHQEKPPYFTNPYGGNEDHTTQLARGPPGYGFLINPDPSEPSFVAPLDPPASGDQVTHYRRAAEEVHSEYAALLVKNNSLKTQVEDLQNRMSSKDLSFLEIKSQLETYKENNARQASHIQSLKDRMKELEEIAVSASSVKAHLQPGLETFKRGNRELNERVAELENRVRIHLLEREKAEQKAYSLEKKVSESISKLSSFLRIDPKGHEDPLNILLTKVSELLKDHFQETSRIASLEEALASQQMEFKASRETIVQLVSEMGKEQKAAAGYTAEIKALKQELDEAVRAKKSMGKDNNILLEKLKDIHMIWDDSQQNLQDKERQMAQLDKTLRTSYYEAKAAQNLHQAFLSQLSTLLGNGFITVPSTEEAIKERIQEVCASEQSWKATNEDLQQKVLHLSRQLEQQRELYHETLSKSIKTEGVLQEQKESLKHLKGKMASEDLLKDGFNFERKKLMRFLQQLAEKLKINQDILTESLQSQYEMLLERAGEVSNFDPEYLGENKVLLYNLQKKVHSLKEKLDFKNTQVEQLEKKVKVLEKEKEQLILQSKEGFQSLDVQKLKNRVEKLQGQLNELKMVNKNLMAQLAEVNQLKNKTTEQNKIIDELNSSLEKLERIKEKAAKKVVSLKTELDYSELETRGEKARAQHMLEAVTNELHTAKRALEEVARREKQLVDFKDTITRMMGFNINTLAVPEHEIVGQLKKLLRSHGSLKDTFDDRSKLPYGLRTGFENPHHSVSYVSTSSKPRF
ncbi:coiled-coil domain-containing protein 170-like [Pleurodeles waltl]|uniref:coiled-coil domain-containing protein 170-like n=1 Tax=Pleurodeles waltl TaxID=8319 RepID=UPI0037098E3E